MGTDVDLPCVETASPEFIMPSRFTPPCACLPTLLARRWLRRATAALTAALPLLAASQILIGQTAGFTGQVAAGVQETTLGARLYLDHINRQGGIAGQKIELISLDDRFDPRLAADNGQELIERRQVLAMFLTRGTPHTQALIPLLEAHGVPLVGPSTGAMALHQPVQRLIFNVRATYQREADKAVQYLASTGISRIAVVHADDSFGRDGLEGASRGLARASLRAAAVIRAERSQPDYGQIIPPLVAAQAQAVLWIASGDAVVGGVRALRKAGSAAQVVTLSNNASAGFIKSLGSDSRGVIVSQVFPSERSYATPFVTEAAALAKARGLQDLSPAMLEGFAAAKVLVEGLRRASPRPTRARLQAALESMGQYDLGGLQVGYSRDDHTGLDFSELSIIGENGRFRR
jgi:ABC-type branched-subunit amino acid transport system substrate-binding protein